jgi:1,4-dihydroxy-2-naphthoate polyprenyltransferase
MPVFLFAICLENAKDFEVTLLLLFLILHVLVYPASNAYNSYMDKDEGSIGGLKHPPKVTRNLFYASLMLDILALGLAYGFLKIEVAGLLLAYIMVSRAYSFRGIRLKKYPIIGYLTVAIFQGVVVFGMVNAQMGKEELDVLGASIAFLLVGAGYPLTQIYQHEQDRRDGVITLSSVLGIRGTFIFSGILFLLLGGLLFLYFLKNAPVLGLSLGAMFLGFLPIGMVFVRWMKECFQYPVRANFENTMKMNLWGGVGLNLLFLVIFMINQL